MQSYALFVSPSGQTFTCIDGSQFMLLRLVLSRSNNYLLVSNTEIFAKWPSLRDSSQSKSSTNGMVIVLNIIMIAESVNIDHALGNIYQSLKLDEPEVTIWYSYVRFVNFK